MPLYHPKIHRCDHVKVIGTQCGSPSLRGNSFLGRDSYKDGWYLRQQLVSGLRLS
jgi:hypothetical protein